MSTTTTPLREKRFAFIDEAIKTDRPRHEIIDAVGISRTALARYCYRYGRPDLGAYFTRLNKARETRCRRCNRQRAGHSGFCDRCRFKAWPRVTAVELVRYARPAGRAFGHVSAYPVGTGLAHIVLLSAEEAAIEFNLWPRRIYRTA